MTAIPKDDRQERLKRNYEAFLKKLPDLLKTHLGKFALVYDGEMVEFFDTAGDAYKFGVSKYGTHVFSIQQITDSPIDLGFFNHAVTERPV